MSGLRTGCAIASMVLAACGSGSLGSVQGHQVSASHAYFFNQGTNNAVFLAASDMANLCEVLKGTGRPGGSYAMMATGLANWNGSSSDPAVPGTYVQDPESTAPGLYSDTVVQSGYGCVAYSAPQAGSGNVRIESFGGFQTGAHLVVDVDLKFGDDRLAGHVDAVYCGQFQPPSAGFCGP